MEFKQLKYFLILVKTGNMTSAARSLFITQQALSKSIIKLEDELDAELFERTQQGMRLTEYGRCLMPYAKRILHAADAASQAISDMKSVRQFAIQMGYVYGSFHSHSAVPPSLIENWETEQKEAIVFQQEYAPDTLIRLLLEEELDLAYSIDPQGMDLEGVTAVTLAEEPLYLLISQSLLNGRTALSLNELEEIPILNWRIGLNPGEHFMELCSNAHFQPKMLYINASFGQCIEHVRMGKGMMIAGASYFRSILSEGLEKIPFPSVSATMRHVLLWKAAKEQPEYVKRLIDYIEKNHKKLKG